MISLLKMMMKMCELVEEERKEKERRRKEKKTINSP